MSAYKLVNVGTSYLLHIGACELISPSASWQWPTFFIATFITAKATGDGKSSQQRVVEVRTLHRPTEPIWHFAHQFMWHPPFAAIWANLPTALTNNWDDSAGNLDTETIRTLTSSNLSPSPASWRLASRDIFMTIPARSQPRYSSALSADSRPMCDVWLMSSLVGSMESVCVQQAKWAMSKRQWTERKKGNRKCVM